MNNQNVEEVYAENARVRERLKESVANLNDAAAALTPDDGKWCVAEIVEHVSLVEEKMAVICSKLLEKAKAAGVAGDGKVVISEDFAQKIAELGSMKLEAPEIVHPTGASIAESLSKMDENQKIFDRLLPLFASLDGSSHRFAHPYFGELSAQEWLALRGGHEARHVRQIEKILEGSKK